MIAYHKRLDCPIHAEPRQFSVGHPALGWMYRFGYAFHCRSWYGRGFVDFYVRGAIFVFTGGRTICDRSSILGLACGGYRGQIHHPQGIAPLVCWYCRQRGCNADRRVG